jgi:alkanesulfonate monooxygenase SsuD/methylene tetrahydromethanopterin reductase-like flavin-dependent oxidoreductase (luciferase family)
MILPNFGRHSSPDRIRRFAAVAGELGFDSVWTTEHIVVGPDAAHVRRVKEQHPDLRVIPRTSPEQVDAMLEAGAEGAVVSFADEPAIRTFADRYR